MQTTNARGHTQNAAPHFHIQTCANHIEIRISQTLCMTRCLRSNRLYSLPHMYIETVRIAETRMHVLVLHSYYTILPTHTGTHTKGYLRLMHETSHIHIFACRGLHVHTHANSTFAHMYDPFVCTRTHAVPTHTRIVSIKHFVRNSIEMSSCERACLRACVRASIPATTISDSQGTASSHCGPHTERLYSRLCCVHFGTSERAAAAHKRECNFECMFVEDTR